MMTLETNEALEILNPCCVLTVDAEVKRLRGEMELDELFADWSDEKKNKFATDYEENLRINEKLENAGVEIKTERHLAKMTNIETVWGGHLKNATCHYVRRVVVSGNTFPIKDAIKSLGFKWERHEKQWVRVAKRGVGREANEVREALAKLV